MLGPLQFGTGLLSGKFQNRPDRSRAWGFRKAITVEVICDPYTANGKEYRYEPLLD